MLSLLAASWTVGAGVLASAVLDESVEVGLGVEVEVAPLSSVTRVVEVVAVEMVVVSDGERSEVVESVVERAGVGGVVESEARVEAGVSGTGIEVAGVEVAGVGAEVAAEVAGAGVTEVGVAVAGVAGGRVVGGGVTGGEVAFVLLV